MKFGSTLESAMIAGWEHNYIRYKTLKHHIRLSLEGASDGAGACGNPARTTASDGLATAANGLSKVGCFEHFMSLLHADLEKVSKFASQMIADKSKHVFYIAGKVAKLGVQPNVSEDPLLRQTQAIVADLVNIASFIRDNIEGFRKITKKYDKRFGGNCTAPFAVLVRQHACLREDAVDQLVVAVSDIFAMIRSASAQQGSGATWKPPDAFDRSTTKYVVHARDVVRVKLMIAEHLPILIVGRKETTGLKVPEDMLRISDSSSISSVYFDNADLDCYHDRILREEGARLFRLRWYGQFETPRDAQQVFVERKTHHESWVMENSVKERFSLKAADVPAYLSGDTASNIPATLTSLANEIQAEMISRKMLPVVRTVYNRTAFQSSTSNDVRISLDTGLSFIDERVEENKNGKSWCRYIPSEGIDCQEVLRFPWAVLEIKLTAGQPPWVETVLASGLLHELKKFSKFAHGVFTLYENSGALRELPYWIDTLRCEVPATIFDTDDNSRSSSRPSDQRRLPVNAEAPTASARDVAIYINDAPAVTKLDSGTTPFVKIESNRSWFSRFMGPVGSGGACSKHSADAMPKRPAKVEPKSYFANERTFIQWLSPVMGLVMVAMGLQSAGDFIGSSKVALLGAVLNGVGVAWMVFALYMYLRRMRMLKNHESSGWDARLGPIMLVVMLMAVCVFGSLSLLNTPFLNSGQALLHAPDLTLDYASSRIERGCLKTPSTFNGVQPNSWELQEEVDASTLFATEAERHAQVRRWESVMWRFVVVDKFRVKERTEHKFCVEGVPCDQLVVRHRYISPDESVAVLKVAVPNSSFAAPRAAESRRSWNKLELNAYCDRQNLGYSLYVAAPPPAVGWNTTAVLGGLMRDPSFDELTSDAKLQPVSVFYQTSYEYKLQNLFGLDDAKVVFQWSYTSESARAFARDAARMEISVKLGKGATLSVLRQAEGLLEALVRS